MGGAGEKSGGGEEKRYADENWQLRELDATLRPAGHHDGGDGRADGPTAPIPSAALRAARLQTVGSGQGSVSAREYLAELPAIAEAIAAGRLDVHARDVPLADVEQAWAATADAKQRIVLTRSCPSWTWRCHQGPFRNFMIVLVARRWGGRGVRT
jgi:hypothetical protein